MNNKRLRIFAGPNGSGKSTFIFNFPASKNLSLGYYVNADDIELQLAKTSSLNITNFGISFDTNDVQTYFKQSTFSPVRLDRSDLWRFLLLKITLFLLMQHFLSTHILLLILLSSFVNYF